MAQTLVSSRVRRIRIDGFSSARDAALWPALLFHCEEQNESGQWKVVGKVSFPKGAEFKEKKLTLQGDKKGTITWIEWTIES